MVIVKIKHLLILYILAIALFMTGCGSKKDEVLEPVEVRYERGIEYFSEEEICQIHHRVQIRDI